MPELVSSLLWLHSSCKYIFEKVGGWRQEQIHSLNVTDAGSRIAKPRKVSFCWDPKQRSCRNLPVIFWLSCRDPKPLWPTVKGWGGRRGRRARRWSCRQARLSQMPWRSSPSSGQLQDLGRWAVPQGLAAPRGWSVFVTAVIRHQEMFFHDDVLNLLPTQCSEGVDKSYNIVVLGSAY